MSEGALDVGDVLEEVVEDDDFRPVSLSQMDILENVGKLAGSTSWVAGELIEVDD